MPKSISRSLRLFSLVLALAAASMVIPAQPASAAYGVGDVLEVRIDPAAAQWGEALQAAQEVSSGVGDPVTAAYWLGTSGQRWKMKIVSIVNGSWEVTFQNLRYSGICLDNWKSNYSTVTLYTCNSGDNQKWLLTVVGSVPGANVHTIKNMHSYNCLRVAEPSNRAYAGSCSNYPWFAIYVL